MALGRWGRSEPMTATAELSVDALVLALKTTFDPVAAGELEASLDLHVDDDRLEVAVAAGRLSVTRANAEDADATLRTDVPTLRELVFRKLRLDDAAAAGAVAVEGDRAAAQRLLDAF
jgi:alkyl sulfatase BDS1-like metallo-beta-lactamase superfamily hydrolase